MHMFYLFYTLLLALALGVLTRPVDRALAGPYALLTHGRPTNARRRSSGWDRVTCGSARTGGAATKLGCFGCLLGRLGRPLCRLGRRSSHLACHLVHHLLLLLLHLSRHHNQVVGAGRQPRLPVDASDSLSCCCEHAGQKGLEVQHLDVLNDPRRLP